MNFIILVCALLLLNFLFAGGFDRKGRERLRRSNRRRHRALEILKERGRAWEAYDNERFRNHRSSMLPKLQRAYRLAQKRYERFPLDSFQTVL